MVWLDRTIALTVVLMQMTRSSRIGVKISPEGRKTFAFPVIPRTSRGMTLRETNLPPPGLT
jgi:hypothetical protein